MQTTIDAAGRLVIPKSLRDLMGLTPGRAVDIVFVDGHVQRLVLALTPNARPMSKGAPAIKQWQSEYVDNGGNLKDVTPHYATLEQANLKRNPKMPLIWSYPGTLYGP